MKVTVTAHYYTYKGVHIKSLKSKERLNIVSHKDGISRSFFYIYLWCFSFSQDKLATNYNQATTASNKLFISPNHLSTASAQSPPVLYYTLRQSICCKHLPNSSVLLLIVTGWWHSVCMFVKQYQDFLLPI